MLKLLLTTSMETHHTLMLVTVLELYLFQTNQLTLLTMQQLLQQFKLELDGMKDLTIMAHQSLTTLLVTISQLECGLTLQLI